MSAYSSEAYDFDMFEDHSAAERLHENKRKSKLKKVAPKTAADKRAEEIKCIKRSSGLIVAVAVIFVFISLQLSAGAARYELIREIAATQAQISVAQAENVRLNSELDGITSIAIIDNYAADVLGMTKVENYQVEYLNMAEGDEVLYSAGQSVK